MIEQDAITGVEAMRLTVVHSDPVPIHLGHAVGVAWTKTGGFLLWIFLGLAKHLAGASLVVANLAVRVILELPDCLEQFQGSNGIDLGGVHRHLETDVHV